MGYRRNSRMGDEIFSTGAAIAPFIFVLMKKIMRALTRQTPIDDSLPDNKKKELLKCNLNNKVTFWKWAMILCIGLEIVVFLYGNAVIADIWYLAIVGYLYFRNKKKLESIQ